MRGMDGEARVEAFGVQVGDLRRVTGLDDPLYEGVEYRSGVTFALRMVEDGQNVHVGSLIQPFSLTATPATCRPWKRATASSFAVGVRSPFGPAMVDAP